MMPNVLAPGYARWEFACKCGCGFDTVDVKLLEILSQIKVHFGNPKVIITSGCRCHRYNYLVGGQEDSQHLLGRAADIIVQGSTLTEIYGYLCSQYLGRFGFGLYPSFVHVDSRSQGIWRQN